MPCAFHWQNAAHINHTCGDCIHAELLGREYPCNMCFQTQNELMFTSTKCYWESRYAGKTTKLGNKL